MGEKDILHDVVKLLDAEQLFWKVRIKPGSPTLAFVCEGTLVLCLSGNPFGAIANFALLARPVLAALTGQKDWLLPMENAVLPVRSAADYITASNNDDGVGLVVEKFMLA